MIGVVILPYSKIDKCQGSYLSSFVSTLTSVMVCDLRRSNAGFGKHFVSMSAIIFDVGTYDSQCYRTFIVVVPDDKMFNVNVLRS